MKEKLVPRVIVFGNEKGGTGKSTLAVHTVVDLLYRGKSVLGIDCDGRQGTFGHYFQNRQEYIKNRNVTLPVPRCISLSLEDEIEAETLPKIIQEAPEDIIVIDTPGSYNQLSSWAHSLADLLVTPLNESYIDLDLFARIVCDVGVAERAGIYADEVWSYKMSKASVERKSMDWLVVKNRESGIRSKNKDDIQKILEKLSKRLGFRLSKGFKERAIFKQLFPEGLTISDHAKVDRKVITVAHITARQELRHFMNDLLVNMPD
jgi:chromosome partitioning protein